MRYMLLIYGNWDDYTAEPGSPEFEAMMQGYYEFGQKLVAAGISHSGDELDGPTTATTLRVRDGASLLSDGPFIESKEQLGGFYILDVENLDEALKWAALIPGAHTGAVEVRPIIEH